MKKILQSFLFFIICGSLINIFIIIDVKAEEGSIGQATKSAIIPDCMIGGVPDPRCDNINVFIWTAINVGTYLFSFIGALALLFFVYGGFMLILSQGIPEKINKGKDAMIAAVIGLIIAFSAYALIVFVSGKIGVQSTKSLNYNQAPLAVELMNLKI